MKKIFLLLLMVAALTAKGKAYTWDLDAYSDNFNLVHAYNNSADEQSVDYYLYAGYFVYLTKPYYAWAAIYLWVENEYQGKIKEVNSKNNRRSDVKFGNYNTGPSGDRIDHIKLAAYGEKKTVTKDGRTTTYYAIANAKADY